MFYVYMQEREIRSTMSSYVYARALHLGIFTYAPLIRLSSLRYSSNLWSVDNYFYKFSLSCLSTRLGVRHFYNIPEQFISIYPNYDASYSIILHALISSKFLILLTREVNLTYKSYSIYKGARFILILTKNIYPYPM